MPCYCWKLPFCLTGIRWMECMVFTKYPNRNHPWVWNVLITFSPGMGLLNQFPPFRTRTYICVYTIYILVYVSFSTPGTVIPQFFTNVKVLVERWIPRIFDAGHRSSNMKVINKWHAFLQNRNFLNGETDEQSLSNHIATLYLAYEGDEGMELSQRLIRAL